MRKLAALILYVLATTSCQRQVPPAQDEQGVSQRPAKVSANGVRPKVFQPAPLSAEKASTERLTQAKHCSLDGLGEKTFASGQIIVSAETPVLVHGWVGIEGDTITAPSSALIRFKPIEADGLVWGVEVPVGGRREDVAKAQGAPALLNSGLDSALDLSSLPKARYQVSLAYGDNNKYICDGGWVVGLEK